MRPSSLVLIVALLVAVLAEAQKPAESRAHKPLTPTFITIDFPGAVATFANAVNGPGQIVGCYTDKSGNMHGFLLSNGVYQTVDHPRSNYNAAYGISDSGVIVGTDSTFIQNGYILRNGKFTTVNFASDINFVAGINVVGDIVGAYDDTCCDLHGYFFTHDKVFTGLDYPGAISTVADGINSSDIVVGIWRDPSNVQHGFMWTAGLFTPIDIPNAASTLALGINSSNGVVGFYNDTAGVSHGFFLRGSKVQTIDFPGATSTQVYGVNDVGMLVGEYTDTSGVQHGFVGHK